MPEENWHAVFQSNEITEGKAIEAIIEGNILAIVQIDGKIYAIDGICAHQGGPLAKGEVSGCILTCPWHGWQYDLPTGKQILSKVIAQKTYRTRVIDDTIQVLLS